MFKVWLLPFIRNTLMNGLQEVLRRIGRSCFRFCNLMSVLLWLVMMFLLGTVKICLENFQCLHDMLSFFSKCWGTFRCLGRSKFGTIFLGPNVFFLCGWCFIANVLHGIIYASMASKVPPCVFYAKIVNKISLISFSTALSLDIFGIFGGMCGTNPIGMFPH